MKVAVLASGSNGNATYVETGELCFLIDDGISLKQLKDRMESLNLDMDKLQAVFITHEHSDHIAGIKMLAKNYDLAYYLSQGTLDGMNNETQSMIAPNATIIKGDTTFELGDCHFTILTNHHDSREAIGLVIEVGHQKLVYITDTGYVDTKYTSLISNADMYVMESNYDVELLWTSNRTFDLKKRIDGNFGHLSNEASAVLLAHIIGDKTRRVIIAHVSDDCNYYSMPELIIKAHQKVYQEFGLDTHKIEFLVGNRHGVTGVYEL